MTGGNNIQSMSLCGSLTFLKNKFMHRERENEDVLINRIKKVRAAMQ